MTDGHSVFDGQEGGQDEDVVLARVVVQYQSPEDLLLPLEVVCPSRAMKDAVIESVGAGRFWEVNATRLATALMGDSIATNLFMVGFAYQRGLLPLSEAAILRAIELNATAVESNRQSFLWGRLAAVQAAWSRTGSTAAAWATSGTRTASFAG